MNQWSFMGVKSNVIFRWKEMHGIRFLHLVNLKRRNYKTSKSLFMFLRYVNGSVYFLINKLNVIYKCQKSVLKVGLLLNNSKSLLVYRIFSPSQYVLYTFLQRICEKAKKHTQDTINVYFITLHTKLHFISITYISSYLEICITITF